MAVLDVKNLKKIYRPRFGGNQVQALSCVNFSVEEGEYVAIMGESGSGKTTPLDQACVDACLKAEPMPNSQLSDNMSRPDFVDHHDHFTNSTPESEWQSCLEHADKIGLGSRDYELIVC